MKILSMRILLILLFVTSTLLGQVKIDKTKAEDFARTFSNEVLTTLQVKQGDNLSIDDRIQNFRKLLHKGIAMHSIGQSSVGLFWNEASDAQKKEFHKLFEDFFTDVYKAHFQSYRVTGVEVAGSREEDDGVWVKTIVKQQDKPDITMEWKVIQGTENLKIINVMIDEFLNFSLNLQKAFTEIIANNGGTFDAILKELREKTTLKKIAQLKE
jgi:phospholipid transport system substrate-binding protein